MPNTAAKIDLSEIDAAIETIRIEFIRKLIGYSEKLERLVGEATALNSFKTGIDEAIFIAHRISGVAGTFGYANLGRIARVAEAGLTTSRDNERIWRDIEEHLQVLNVLRSEISLVCADYSADKIEPGPV